nr:hypothetical protein CFP56_03961 [Quercus suber]
MPKEMAATGSTCQTLSTVMPRASTVPVQKTATMVGGALMMLSTGLSKQRRGRQRVGAADRAGWMAERAVNESIGWAAKGIPLPVVPCPNGPQSGILPSSCQRLWSDRSRMTKSPEDLADPGERGPVDYCNMLSDY